MKYLRLVVFWGLILGASSAVLAQSYQMFQSEVDGIVSRTWLKFGPFRIIPQLNFSNFGWTSNIFGEGVAPGSVSDIMITPSPQLNVFVIWRRWLILSFTENPEYHFYFRQHQFNGFANSYSGSAKFLLFDRFILSGQYVSQTQRGLAVLELDRQVQSTVQGIDVKLIYATPRNTTITLDASRAKNTYQDILLGQGSPDLVAATLNNETTMGGIEFAYHVGAASQLFLRTSYARMTFSDPLASQRRSDAAEVVAGVRLPEAGIFQGTLSFGYKKYMPTSSATKGYSGPIGSALFGIRFENFGRLELSYDRDVQNSYLQNEIYYLNDTYSATLIFRVFSFFLLKGGGQIMQLNYPSQTPGFQSGSGDSSSPGASILTDYSRVFGGFIVRLSKTFGIGLNYNYWRRGTKLFGNNFHGSLVTLDITRQF